MDWLTQEAKTHLRSSDLILTIWCDKIINVYNNNNHNNNLDRLAMLAKICVWGFVWFIKNAEFCSISSELWLLGRVISATHV